MRPLQFTVVPITKDAVTKGEETLVDLEDPTSSSSGRVTSNETAGNNVIAYKPTQSSTTFSSSPNSNSYLQHHHRAHQRIQHRRHTHQHLPQHQQSPRLRVQIRVDRSVLQFPKLEFPKGGGAEGDRVFLSVQDPGGTNNANFATPPEYVLNMICGKRCLTIKVVVNPGHKGGGMGEGWSDAMAEWTEHKDSTVPDYVLATWVVNNLAGIRSHPYSTNASINPLRYSSIQQLHEVHDIGEVWANILRNVYASLVSVHGFSSTAVDDPSGTEGNIVWLHLFIDALSLQPCNPTFVNARDAWIQADQNRHDGANACILWNAFASRGLGVNAADYVDDTSIPSGC
ncbi:Fungalysin metallopeptidase-domain-containing protein [Armillaria luteobubalina]|uniref:Extracellular metalloproteinase n=1 Tax=Armillaria luteobubalina TaxID=153913 RepID=A0AA39PDE0_9AGAR|nr:Fungalysin metallopeptidase-domain-containing protein [Armillaria luteobubalina]